MDRIWRIDDEDDRHTYWGVSATKLLNNLTIGFADGPSSRIVLTSGQLNRVCLEKAVIGSSKGRWHYCCVEQTPIFYWKSLREKYDAQRIFRAKMKGFWCPLESLDDQRDDRGNKQGETRTPTRQSDATKRQKPAKAATVNTVNTAPIKREEQSVILFNFFISSHDDQDNWGSVTEKEDNLCHHSDDDNSLEDESFKYHPPVVKKSGEGELEGGDKTHDTTEESLDDSKDENESVGLTARVFSRLTYPCGAIADSDDLHSESERSEHHSTNGPIVGGDDLRCDKERSTNKGLQVAIVGTGDPSFDNERTKHDFPSGPIVGGGDTSYDKERVRSKLHEEVAGSADLHSESERTEHDFPSESIVDGGDLRSDKERARVDSHKTC
ncbi:hypothetical protein KIN20_027135 [Parelaphostrongylus tenuis]|uniref:Uncharacterized protein n=1 Tax=Parelaphostrongylus tenuis TaxID=148309 RepID=A0AAD5QYW7_PARTN|nr:hypothetical protein KIN20_027135 [Parelaphostrongylus tenuis]